LTSQQDLISLFWLFQSYKQKKAEPELLKTGQELMARFPLTYYGLIAHDEIQKRLPQFEQPRSRLGKILFSAVEQLKMDRAKLLIGAGLIDEAGEELAPLSDRELTPDESLYLAQYFAQALKYTRAFGLLNQAFDRDPAKRLDPVVKQIFPKEFWELISDDKRRGNVDPYLIVSLMKQESAFDPNALSRSQAVGLMQMILPTAEEVKKELGAKVELPRDLYDPSINIRFCSYYLEKLIKKFDGSVPLALAAYNAGPTRIGRFLSSIQNIRETWVDELPLSETSFYVKSILKNYLMYRTLYGGLEKIPNPSWSPAPSTPAPAPSPKSGP
ncbi:MAG: lytic transglycosylase domain-containing protein, partial [Oligoflexia bacterium]|nr:lytic transglycosylase domain-containing protein [Oligoflexia bacterium]